MKPWALLRWAAGLAILALVLLTTDVSGIGDAFSEAELAPTLATIALNVPVLLLVTLRSRMIMSRMGHVLPPGLMFSTVTLGFVAGSFTPGASGELLRTEALRTSAGVTAHDGLALVAFERVLSFYLLLLVGAAVGAVLLFPAALAALIVIVCVVACAAPAFAGPLLRIIPAPRSEPSTLWQRVLVFFRTMLSRMETLLRDKGLVARWSAVTLVTFAIIAVQFWLLTEAVDSHLSYAEALAAFAGPQLLSNISLIPLGLGIVDGGIVGLLTSRGLSDSQALSTAVLVRATITLPLVAAAVLSYVYISLQRGVPSKDAEAV